MKAIPVHEAVGTVLGHDITRIVPGQEKGTAYRKGHVITREDIPGLLTVGKEHIFVFDLRQGFVHEDDAALRLAGAARGQGLALSAPSEGKVTLTAAHAGLLKVDVERLTALNSIEDIVFATAHSNQQVQAGQPVAGTRVVPLVIEEEKLERAELALAGRPLIEVKPFAPTLVGMVTTGSEVFSGRIRDGFGPVVRRKFESLGSTVFRQVIVNDEIPMCVAAIRKLLAEGAQMIVVTGGMSVDPDDQTPASIREAGGKVVGYGAPVLPGAMFLLAMIGNVPVLGLPGCVMYHKASIFDLVVPRLLAGETVSARDIAALGHGGLCMACPECRYPVCPFGKGQ
ncbi:molybdopterin-binding protein [Fundidesulfovibrio terrae]|uniref:molybdopterin-binding protein n=1 Tax=Fundidesulfovibrio terrae TaxID=2922866 RepID=UPI001FAF5CA1|nr:molybdopterin-binding protein [Fundidesulfovibrio terrae]